MWRCCYVNNIIFILAFNDYGSSDDNSTKSDKDGNCSTTSNSETDDTDDQDFFGLSCKIKVKVCL